MDEFFCIFCPNSQVPPGSEVHNKWNLLPTSNKGCYIFSHQTAGDFFYSPDHFVLRETTSKSVGIHGKVVYTPTSVSSF
jgi:hypothetical protein